MYKTKTKLLVYVALAALPFFFLFVHSSTFDPIKTRVIEGTSLPLRIILFPLQEAKKILFYHRIYNEYLRIKTELDILKGRLIGWEEVSQENIRLAQLLSLKKKIIYSSVAANVIGRDPSNWNATIIIDKGTRDQVSVGMPVVNALGVVGKVAEAEEGQAKVILITDPGFSVAALVQRSREVGLVSGSLRGVCRMRYLSPEADVQIADQVITSKLSSSFPEGLLIGEVIEIESRKNTTMVNCLIQPAVSLHQIEEVLVIQTE